MVAAAPHPRSSKVWEHSILNAEKNNSLAKYVEQGGNRSTTAMLEHLKRRHAGLDNNADTDSPR